MDKFEIIVVQIDLLHGRIPRKLYFFTKKEMCISRLVNLTKGFGKNIQILFNFFKIWLKLLKVIKTVLNALSKFLHELLRISFPPTHNHCLNLLKGLRVPVSKARYRTIESLLDDLNSNISMPFGVRRLTTPRGKTSIKSIDELQHHGRLVF